MSSTLMLLQEGVAQMLQSPPVDAHAPLSEVGIDSLNVVELVLLCQEIYPNVVAYEQMDVTEHTTLFQLDQQLSGLEASNGLVAAQ